MVRVVLGRGAPSELQAKSRIIITCKEGRAFLYGQGLRGIKEKMNLLGMEQGPFIRDMPCGELYRCGKCGVGQYLQ